MLFEEELDFVWNCLARLGVRSANMDDAINDVFLALHKNIGAYDSSRPLRPWLFAFVYRIAAEYRRTQARDSRAVELEQLPDTGANPEQHALASESVALVRHALALLDVDKRAVFMLHELEDMVAPEIALALDVPLNTVYSRLRLARVEFEKNIRRAQLTGIAAPPSASEESE